MSDLTANKNEKAVKILTEEEKEKIYIDANKLIDSLQCVKQYELYLYVYQIIIKKLKRITEYKNSKELLAKYEQEYEQYRTDEQEKIYQNMLQLQSQVTRAEDVQWVMKEAERIPGYKDVDEVKKWCQNTMEEMEQKEKRNGIKRLVLIFIILVILGIGGMYFYNMYIR